MAVTRLECSEAKKREAKSVIPGRQVEGVRSAQQAGRCALLPGMFYEATSCSGHRLSTLPRGGMACRHVAVDDAIARIRASSSSDGSSDVARKCLPAPPARGSSAQFVETALARSQSGAFSQQSGATAKHAGALQRRSKQQDDGDVGKDEHWLVGESRGASSGSIEAAGDRSSSPAMALVALFQP